MHLRTVEWAAEFMEAQAGVERLDGEHAAAFMPEHQEPQGADAVCGHKLWPPTAQERAVAVPAKLHSPDLAAERANQHGRATGSDLAVQAPREFT